MGLSLFDRIQLLWGVVRRYYLNRFRPDYVRKSVARRHGGCLRCGACCQLSMRCHHYRVVDGLPRCALYGQPRPVNCHAFPIDARDLADRDLIEPNHACGHSWIRETVPDQEPRHEISCKSD